MSEAQALPREYPLSGRERDGKPIRILLVDDHVVMRAGLRMLIQSWPRMKVVGEVGRSDSALTMARIEKPDIVLLDLNSGLNDESLSFLSSLASAVTRGSIIVLTDAKDSESRLRAFQWGARGVVLKEKGETELIQAIRKVHAGEAWIERSLVAMLIADVARPQERAKSDEFTARIDTLTKREREVAGLVCQGLKNSEIGARLFISATTVHHHITSILGKIGVDSRVELLLRCRERLTE